MSAFTQAFYSRMVGDATLTAMLGTFGGAASVFTKTPLPAGMSLEDNGPYILTTGQATDTPGDADTKNSRGRDIIRDIKCYTDLDRSPADVDAIAERVLFLFHKQSFTVTGFSIIVSAAEGPIEADEDDAFGRIVSVRLMMEEV